MKMGNISMADIIEDSIANIEQELGVGIESSIKVTLAERLQEQVECWIRKERRECADLVANCEDIPDAVDQLLKL